jgi:hypothetical protein
MTAKITMNIIKNSNITIKCRARIKNIEEKDLVDSVIQAVKETDTHITRIRFDRNPVAYGSRGTRFVKTSYSPVDNVFELYVNLAKVTHKSSGNFVLSDVSEFIDNIRITADRFSAKSAKFINKVNKKYKVTV